MKNKKFLKILDDKSNGNIEERRSQYHDDFQTNVSL